MDAFGNKRTVLVAIDEPEAPVWASLSQRLEPVFARDGRTAYRLLREQSFDLVLLDLYLTGMDSLELLRRIRAERLCRSVILTSETPSFSYAQQGILNGVSAYLLRPIEEEELKAALRRIQTEHSPETALIDEAAAQAVSFLRTAEAEERFAQLGEGLLRPTEDAVTQSLRWRDFYEETIRRTYQTYGWLRLYCHPEEFLRPDFLRDRDERMVEHFCRRRIGQLNDVLLELFPVCGTRKLDEVICYLLQSIDENVQQKTAAERFYITNSTLSTRFQSQLGLSYREYMTRIKMRRAEYLLRYTDVRTKELAGRLGYKDRDHFAKLFFQRTGKTLQEYEQMNSGGHYNI